MRTLRIVLIILVAGLSTRAMAKVKAGDKAPDYGLHSLFDPGKEYWVGDLVGPYASHKNKVLVLVFAASYCKPCWKELPQVIALHEKYKDRGVQVLYVVADLKKPGWEKAKKKLARAKGKFPCVRLVVSAMGNAYLGKTWHLPSMFVIDAQGRVAGIFHVLDREGRARVDRLIDRLIGGGK